MHRFAGLLAALPALGVAMSDAAAQADYPAKPVRIVVAYAAGGGDDYIARLFADKLTHAFGRNFLVENRPSAGGIIGFDTLAKSAPDGYTLGLAGANITIVPSVRKNLPFDSPRDFTPVSQLTATQLVLVVHPSVPAHSIRELIALGKKRPGDLAFASSGVGATPHLSAELFKTMTGVDMLHVPYRSGSIAMTDLAAGRVDMYFGLIGGVITSLVEAGKLRALAVTGTHRHHMFPDVPTMSEAGVPGYVLTTWYSMLGPAGMPTEVVQVLNRELRKAVASADVVQKLRARGIEPKSSTPEELGGLMVESKRRFAEIARKAGIEPE